jgi:hypothetical protein
VGKAFAVAVLLLAACGRERIDVEGVVVGSSGLPVEGANVVVSGHPSLATDASGRFAVRGVEVPYDVLVGVNDPIFQRGFAAGWLGLRRKDPFLVLANQWPQVGAHYASVCGTASGAVTFPSEALWVVVDPAAPFGDLPQASHVDPGTGTYCAGSGWMGAPARAGAVHVLAVERASGEGGSSFAVGFPAAGTVAGLSLSDGAALDGVDVPLAPASSAPLEIEVTGPGASDANLFASAYYGGAWLGGGVPLADLRSGTAWPSVATPLVSEAQVRLQVWSYSGGLSWRERTLTPGVAAASLDLPAVPVALEPPDGGNAAAGVRFRWAPAAPRTVSVLEMSADPTATTPLTGLMVYAPSPDVRLPDFGAVGVPIPAGATGRWNGYVIGPLPGMDALVTPEHMGLALRSGLLVDEYALGGTAFRALSFGP